MLLKLVGCTIFNMFNARLLIQKDLDSGKTAAMSAANSGVLLQDLASDTSYISSLA